MSQPLLFPRMSDSAARSRRERRARTTRFADVQKWPSILRGGTGIPKDVPGHGSARSECKSSEGCKETRYPPQHLATPDSGIGTGRQVIASGSPPPAAKRARPRSSEERKSNEVGKSTFTLIGLPNLNSSVGTCPSISQRAEIDSWSLCRIPAVMSVTIELQNIGDASTRNEIAL